MKIATRRSLSLAVALSLSISSSAYAGYLNPGESASVVAGDAPEAWRVYGGSLVLNPNAEALGIDLWNGGTARLLDGSSATNLEVYNGSSVTTNGATVRGSDNFLALAAIHNASATFVNSTIENASGIAMAVAANNGVGSSTVSLANSSVKGIGLATYVAGSTLDLSASALSSTGTENLFGLSAGLAILSNSAVTLSNGTSVVGDENGIVVVDDQFPSNLTDNTLLIDSSTVAGRTGSGIVVNGVAGIDRTTITVRNGSTVTGGNGVVAEAANGGILDFNVQGSHLQGTLRADATSTFNATLANGAMLSGATDRITSLGIDNATWRVTADSNLGALSVRGGWVEFEAGATFKTLRVDGDLAMDGATFAFNTVLAGDASATDKLIIGGDTSGTAHVRVNNVGGAGAQTSQGIELIRVAGASNGQFDLAGRAVGGQYEYFLFKGADNGNWYLRSQLPDQPDPCAADPGLPGCPPLEPVLRPEGGAYLANLQAAQGMFRLGYHDRHAGQNSGRAWARVDGSRTGFDAVSRQLDIHGNSQALSVGADVWRTDTGSAVGVMLSSGNASSTSTNTLTGYYARGKVKGEALGVYGTWRGGSTADPYAGFYVDGTLQRAQFRNRVEGVALATERYDNRAWQGALEAGYAFRIGGASNGGLFLEPQLQVGYNRWDDTRHVEANGTVVTNVDADGLFGRAGLRLSGVTRWGDGSVDVQPYIAAHWLHTRAESQVRMDEDVIDARIPRSRGEFSGGASLRFANGVGAWAGLSLQKTSGYHQTSAQLGMSYSW